MAHCTLAHRNCQATLLSYLQKESAWSLHVRDKTRQELYYYHRAAFTVRYGKVQGTSRVQCS